MMMMMMILYLQTFVDYFVNKLHLADGRYTTPCFGKEVDPYTTFIFTITSAYADRFSYFFPLKFRKELRRKLASQLSHPSNLLPHYRQWRRSQVKSGG